MEIQHRQNIYQMSQPVTIEFTKVIITITSNFAQSACKPYCGQLKIQSESLQYSDGCFSPVSRPMSSLIFLSRLQLKAPNKRRSIKIQQTGKVDKHGKQMLCTRYYAFKNDREKYKTTVCMLKNVCSLCNLKRKRIQRHVASSARHLMQVTNLSW